MHAHANDKIEVLDDNDSCKLYNILDGKRVITQFMGMAQPVGGSRCKWRLMTRKMVRSGSFV
jgi:hypothetical protein